MTGVVEKVESLGVGQATELVEVEELQVAVEVEVGVDSDDRSRTGRYAQGQVEGVEHEEAHGHIVYHECYCTHLNCD